MPTPKRDTRKPGAVAARPFDALGKALDRLSNHHRTCPACQHQQKNPDQPIACEQGITLLGDAMKRWRAGRISLTASQQTQLALDLDIGDGTPPSF